LDENLLKADATKAARAKVAEWLYQPELPADAPNPTAASLQKVEEEAKAFASGKAPAKDLPGKKWTAQEWIHFLTVLPASVGRDRMVSLDEAFTLTKSENSEVLFQWLLLALRNKYDAAMDRLDVFLMEQGRRKFLKPLYEDMVKTPDGKLRAVAIYRIARPTYHSASVETVDAILGWKEGE
jgi:hypothetical protein